MSEESFSKSRLYFEGLLPGNIYAMHNQSFAKIVGVRNNDEDTKSIDEIQLLDVARKIVREWDNIHNAVVDSTLINALEHPLNYIKIMSPEAVYVEPFPMMLICRICSVLDYSEPNLKESEKIQKAYARIRMINNIPRIKCRRSGCNGDMVQLRYVSMHRCGYLGQLNVPFASGRTSNLGYRDQGGAFIHNAFFDVDTQEQKDHALQRDCPHCTKDYPGAEGNNRRATSVNLRDKFYPHNIQYLCLSTTNGQLVSDASKLIGSPGEPLSEAAKDIAEGVSSCLIGIAQPDELIKHLENVLSGKGGGKEGIQSILDKLDEKRRTRSELLKAASSNGISDDLLQRVLEPIDADIVRYENELSLAQGRFSNIADYGFNDDSTLQNLAARRRSMESVLLEYDSKAHRRTLDELIRHEIDPIHKDRLLHDAFNLRTRYSIKDVIHYKEINVVMASIGYTREKAQPISDSGSDQVPTVLMGYEDLHNDSLKGKRILYAMPAKTEAIQIRIDPCKVLKWCIDVAGWDQPNDGVLESESLTRAHLLQTSSALSMDPSEVLAATKNRPTKESAPFHLLHTISHCLLGTIKRHTGYDEKSVMEYLLPMDLSFVLYVTSVQNYTAGGLLTLFKHYCREWFDDASNYAFNCIFDPICSDKGCSCSGCVQIVIGCETFNHGLSRCYIHGGKLEADSKTYLTRGFWS